VKKTRRTFLKTLAHISSLALFPTAWLTSALALANWPKQFLSDGTYEQTIKILFADKEIVDSDKIHLKLPRVAENGAIVPLTISSTLADLKKFYVLVEKNPRPLSAQFHLSSFAEAELSLRLKMAKSCNVIVIAENATGKLFQAKKFVKVTVGGCGG